MSSQMTSRERVLTALKLGVPDRVPWVESYIDKKLAENLTGGKLAKHPGTPRMYPEVLKVLSLDNLNYNLAPPRFAEIHNRDGMEIVGEGKIKTWEDLEKCKSLMPNPHDKKFYKPMMEYIKNHREDYALAAAIRFGPGNTYISMGIEHFSYSLIDQPDLVDAVMDMFSSYTLKVLDTIPDIGVDLFYVSDDLAFKTGTFVSPKHMERFFMPHMRKIASKLEKPWIFHSCGNINSIFERLLLLGMNGISNIEPGPMDIFQLKKDYGKRVCLIGNIDIHYTLPKGTTEETETEVKEKIEKLAPGGGYILASANSLTAYLKPENVLAMNRALLKYGSYPI